tara:strand:- start:549 stop:779 length:231 start_codon:yes stop_codon:yes gene_type:complete
MSKWADFLLNFDKAAETLPKGENWKTMHEIVQESPWGSGKTRVVVMEALKNGEIELFEGYKRKGTRLVRQRWYRHK